MSFDSSDTINASTFFSKKTPSLTLRLEMGPNGRDVIQKSEIKQNRKTEWGATRERVISDWSYEDITRSIELIAARIEHEDSWESLILSFI